LCGVRGSAASEVVATALAGGTEEPMERILETHKFGPHQVAVLEHAEDDETTYSILVDSITATEAPLQSAPSFEDVVRIYTHAVEQRV
jgi:hypothetical protein